MTPKRFFQVSLMCSWQGLAGDADAQASLSRSRWRAVSQHRRIERRHAEEDRRLVGLKKEKAVVGVGRPGSGLPPRIESGKVSELPSL